MRIVDTGQLADLDSEPGAAFLGRAVGGPDDVHGLEVVGRPRLVLGAGEQALDEMPLGRRDSRQRRPGRPGAARPVSARGCRSG